jgi:RimJ/RimL family protein N-acetyltransferase
MSLHLRTSRLTLRPLTVLAIDRWLEGDAEGFLQETGVRLASPVDAPPLLGEDLPALRGMMAETPGQDGWWLWMVARASDAEGLGVAGFFGPPAEDEARIGYSVYERHQGMGYATEALETLLAWAWEQGVTTVSATIPPWNAPSIRVAEKLGMVLTGTEEDPEVGTVLVYATPS